MASAKQIAANRANARRSTGPRTPQGKAIVRLNAVKDGLTGQLTIVPRSEYSTYVTLERRMTASLNPIGEQELQLASRIVRDTWRLHRLAANEENLYALGLIENEAALTSDPSLSVALSNAQTFRDRSRDFDRSSLCEQRLNRSLHKNYALFRELQKERNRPPMNHIPRTRKFKEHPVAGFPKPADYNEHGFVFADCIAELSPYPPGFEPAPQTPVFYPPVKLSPGRNALCLS